jgi:hypothetical protein
MGIFVQSEEKKPAAAKISPAAAAKVTDEAAWTSSWL